MSDYGKFLTGTVMFQNKKDSVVVTIADVRETSYGREVLDLEEEIFGCSSIPLNQTNTIRLRKLFGRERTQWIGQTVEFTRYITRNPQTNENTYGVYLDDGTGPPDTSQFASRQSTAKQPAKAPSKQPAKAPAKHPEKAPAKRGRKDDVPF